MSWSPSLENDPRKVGFGRYTNSGHIEIIRAMQNGARAKEPFQQSVLCDELHP